MTFTGRYSGGNESLYIYLTKHTYSVRRNNYISKYLSTYPRRWMDAVGLRGG